MLPPSSDKMRLLEDESRGVFRQGENEKEDAFDVQDFWLHLPPPYEEISGNEDSGSGESSPTHDDSSQDEGLIQPENTAWLTSNHPAGRLRSRTIARLLEPENTSWSSEQTRRTKGRPRSSTNVARLLEPENTAWSSEQTSTKNRPRSSTNFAQMLEPENTAWVPTQRVSRTRARASTFSVNRAEMLDNDNRAWVRVNPISTSDSLLSRAKDRLLSPVSGNRIPLIRLPQGPSNHSVNAGDLLSGDNSAWISTERLAKKTRGRASTVSHPVNIAQPLEPENRAWVNLRDAESDEEQHHHHGLHLGKVKEKLSPIAHSPILPRLHIPHPHLTRSRSNSRSPGSAPSNQYLSVPPTHVEESEEDNVSWADTPTPVSPVNSVINAISALRSPTRKGSRRATISVSAAEMSRP